MQREYQAIHGQSGITNSIDWLVILSKMNGSKDPNLIATLMFSSQPISFFAAVRYVSFRVQFEVSGITNLFRSLTLTLTKLEKEEEFFEVIIYETSPTLLMTL